MAKRLDCPLEGCHASIEAETEDEIMEQVATHAEQAHPELELTPDTVADIRSGIVEI